ncbi:hypothetical protein [Microbispora sp. CA-102843]|uniref:hypothetical protein n=1 Tax=Microbispora sp. CA-102843 TaxID=3239952 RepID=UPI003D8B9EF1
MDEVVGQPVGQAFQQAAARDRLGYEAVTVGRVGNVRGRPFILLLRFEGREWL